MNHSREVTVPGKNRLLISEKMEKQIQNQEPKQKTKRDFFILFLAIGGLIAALLLLKLAIKTFHFM